MKTEMTPADVLRLWDMVDAPRYDDERLRSLGLSRRSLLARINRRLAGDGLCVRTARGATQLKELGEHYEVQVSSGAVTTKWVCVMEWARKLGVLTAAEKANLLAAEVMET